MHALIRLARERSCRDRSAAGAAFAHRDCCGITGTPELHRFSVATAVARTIARTIVVVVPALDVQTIRFGLLPW